MSDDAKINLLFYVNLTTDEELKLEAVDSNVASLVIKTLGITTRPVWKSKDQTGTRMIQLMISDHKPPTVFEIPSSELISFSSSELMHAIDQRISHV